MFQDVESNIKNAPPPLLISGTDIKNNGNVDRIGGNHHQYFKTKDTTVETLSINKKGATVSVQPVTLNAGPHRQKTPFSESSQIHFSQVDLKGEVPLTKRQKVVTRIFESSLILSLDLQTNSKYFIHLQLKLIIYNMP